MMIPTTCTSRFTSIFVLGLTCLINQVSSLSLTPNTNDGANIHRRVVLKNAFAVAAAITTTTAAATPPALAAGNKKSRTEGYPVQHTEREWAYILSGAQYNILRQGGTERQRSSILNTFTSSENVGTYKCAGCETQLFSSVDKFSSNTGWPSYSAALDGVEEESLDPIRATLDGREVRCKTCGGHLGDLFNDGWVYVGTSAAKTGKRYCIDGAALVFKPIDGGEDVFGDTPPPNKVIHYEPQLYRSIT
jgi:peptide-methionine (R)-S-oxide reductase